MEEITLQLNGWNDIAISCHEFFQHTPKANKRDAKDVI